MVPSMNLMNITMEMFTPLVPKTDREFLSIDVEKQLLFQFTVLSAFVLLLLTHSKFSLLAIGPSSISCFGSQSSRRLFFFLLLACWLLTREANESVLLKKRPCPCKLLLYISGRLLFIFLYTNSFGLQICMVWPLVYMATVGIKANQLSLLCISSAAFYRAGRRRSERLCFWSMTVALFNIHVI